MSVLVRESGSQEVGWRVPRGARGEGTCAPGHVELLKQSMMSI